MNKSYLVARRELVENVRTKAFWIGILAFPVILALSIAVPRLLEKTKEARAYAVIDESGWLLQAVIERSTTPDLTKVFRAVVRKAKNAPEDLERMPEFLRRLAPTLTAIEPQSLDEVAAFFSSQSSGAPESAGYPINLPPEHADALRAGLEDVRRWWRALPPDEAGEFAANLDKSRYSLVDVGNLEVDPRSALKAKVDRGELFAFIEIPKDPVSGTETCKYFSKNLTDDGLKSWFSALANEEVKRRRFVAESIPEGTVKKILEPLKFEALQAGEKPDEVVKVDNKSQIRQWAPVVFVYLLWISIFTIGQMLLTNTIEEKSNRIIEVLLSSISPLELMTGKIFGIAATGLTLIVSWVAFFFLALKFGPRLFGIELPFDLGFIIQDPAFLASFIGYFLAGYFLYAALFVGIGSVCNSLKEAQNLMMPMMIILLIPLFAMMPIGQDPNGALARFMSYIPLFTPFVMMNRAAGPPTTMEYVVTTIIVLVTIVVLFIGAAKVFRIGILMTGKPPKLREIIQWMRAPVGRGGGK